MKSIAVALVAMLSSCSGSDPALAPDASTGGLALEVSLDIPLGPGEERWYCKQVAIPAGGIEVGTIESIDRDGVLHHLIVSAASAGETAGDVIESSCFASPVVVAPFFATQSATTTAFPDGVAHTLEEEQMLMVEVHALNTRDTAVDARFTVNLFEPEAPADKAVGFFFWDNLKIVVEPNQEATVKMRCEVTEEIQLFSVIPHTHTIGTGFRASLHSASAEPMPLIDISGGFDPSTVWLEPELTVKPDQWIEFECDFLNSGTEAVVQGSLAGDEMCSFMGGYYKDEGTRSFFFERCLSGSSGPIYGGAATCADSFDCLGTVDWSGSTGYLDYSRCFVGTCADSSAALNELESCWATRCPSECPDHEAVISSDCQTCIANRCDGALAACQAATCSN